MAIYFILIVGREGAVSNYQNAVSSAGFIPIITDSTELLETAEHYGNAPCHGALSRMDMLLLPGGGDIAPDLLGKPNLASREIDRSLDLVQFAYLEYFLSQGKPVIGICKGMQMINAALGGELLQDMPPTQLPHHIPINHVDNRHGCVYVPLEETAPFPMRPLYQKLGQSGLLPQQINSAHHQCIQTLSQELFCFQRASDGVIEGFIHRFLPILWLQWHPERLFFAQGSYLKLFLHLLLSGAADSAPQL